MSRVAQHVHVQKLGHVSAPVCVVFLPEGRADGGAFFLDHLALLRLGPGCPDGPDQLPQSDRRWHSLPKPRGQGSQGGYCKDVLGRIDAPLHLCGALL